MAYTPKHLNQTRKSRKGKKAVWIFDLAAGLFLCLLLVGGGMLLKNTFQSKQAQSSFQELAALVEAQTAPVQAPATPAGPPEETAAETSAAEEVSPYQVLFERNPDFAGWLTVPGTRIDYPVMHTPKDADYYIYRAFDGSDSPSGTPFVGDYGSLEEQRCVIYGHNMGDGTMFHDLLEYMDEDFWKANPTFTITTLDGPREYEIFAAVQTRLLTESEQGLRYYRLEDGVEQWLIKRSWYDTGIVPEEGDSVVLLSTCSYHTDEGRFVVAGRLVP